MVNSVFLDTNIVLDLLVKEREQHRSARLLIGFLMDRSIDIVISEDMLSTIYYISRDKKKALEFMQSVQHRWQISPYGRNVIADSLDYALKNECDLEDALQCFCAIENRCKVLITSDKYFNICGDIELVDYSDYERVIDASR